MQDPIQPILGYINPATKDLLQKVYLTKTRNTFLRKFGFIPKHWYCTYYLVLTYVDTNTTQQKIKLSYAEKERLKPLISAINIYFKQ